jgi:hypothetical protein
VIIQFYDIALPTKVIAEADMQAVPRVGEDVMIMSNVHLHPAGVDISQTHRGEVVSVTHRAFDESTRQPSSGIYVHLKIYASSV